MKKPLCSWHGTKLKSLGKLEIHPNYLGASCLRDGIYASEEEIYVYASKTQKEREKNLKIIL